MRQAVDVDSSCSKSCRVDAGAIRCERPFAVMVSVRPRRKGERTRYAVLEEDGIEVDGGGR